MKTGDYALHKHDRLTYFNVGGDSLKSLTMKKEMF